MRIQTFSLALIVSLLMQGLAWAHPHVFVNVDATVHVNNQQQLTQIDFIWAFDHAYSAFAIQGLDTNNDKKLSQEELTELAQINVESLKEYHYFTQILSNRANKSTPVDHEIQVHQPEKAYLTYDDKTLVLHLSLAPIKPIQIPQNGIIIDLFDTEYFVAFEFPQQQPTYRLKAIDTACRLDLDRPKPLDEETANLLALIPQSGAIPEDLKDVTATQANRLRLQCAP